MRLAGEIDLDALDAMDTATETVVGLAPASVIVDVAAVTFIDSSGLNALLALRKRGAEIGTSVTLLNPSPQVTALLDMTGLAHYFGMADDSAHNAPHD